jgi:hypothetical protein
VYIYPTSLIQLFLNLLSRRRPWILPPSRLEALRPHPNISATAGIYCQRQAASTPPRALTASPRTCSIVFQPPISRPEPGINRRWPRGPSFHARKMAQSGDSNQPVRWCASNSCIQTSFGLSCGPLSAVNWWCALHTVSCIRTLLKQIMFSRLPKRVLL